jgi:hypothetical protein
MTIQSLSSLPFINTAAMRLLPSEHKKAPQRVCCGAEIFSDLRRNFPVIRQTQISFTKEKAGKAKCKGEKTLSPDNCLKHMGYLHLYSMRIDPVKYPLRGYFTISGPIM